uniref:Receptor ligand binding region domain-containing protein n=1 Tax=Anopheles farauti TaxID=69004 RepID=A0A182QPP2_9DIPT
MCMNVCGCAKSTQPATAAESKTGDNYGINHNRQRQFEWLAADKRHKTFEYRAGHGAIFEQGTDEIQSAFKFAMLNHNLNVSARRFELQAYVDVINTADAFKLSKLICNQFSRGVFAMLGAVSPDSFDTLHSYSNTFQMPFVTPWFPEKVLTPSSGFLDFAISMRPDYYQAIIDTVRYYGWDRIIYMYDSHDERSEFGIERLATPISIRHLISLLSGTGFCCAGRKSTTYPEGSVLGHY